MKKVLITRKLLEKWSENVGLNIIEQMKEYYLEFHGSKKEFQIQQ